MKSEDYLEINRHSWNNRTDAHVKSEFYDQEGFMNGRSSLNEIELSLLGDVRNKSVLHLQCHFGQDSISLVRLGAEVTAIDLSDTSIKTAREINKKLGLDCRFINCNVYDVPDKVEGEFDFVFTSYGVNGWLPDLNKWANVIFEKLKPGGKLIFVEFHPVVWMYDDDFKGIAYRYFNSGPISEEEEGTYADTSAPIKQKYIMWNHGLAEVFTSLTEAGLIVEKFQEFDYSPYPAFAGVKEYEPGKFQIEKFGNKVPLVYAMVASKPEQY